MRTRYHSLCGAAASLAASLVSIAGSVSGQEVVEIGPGHPSLDPSVVAPHRVVWEMTTARDGHAKPAGHFARKIDRVVHTRGEPAFLNLWQVDFPNRSALDIYYADPSTLAPLARYVTSPRGMWVLYFYEGRAVVTHTRRTGGEPTALDLPLEIPRFPFAMIDVLLAALPLREGSSFRFFLADVGASSPDEGFNAWAAARVVERQTISDEALPGEVDAWMVDVERSNGVRQRLWIRKAAPYLIRREIYAPDGSVNVRWSIESFSPSP